MTSYMHDEIARRPDLSAPCLDPQVSAWRWKRCLRRIAVVMVIMLMLWEHRFWYMVQMGISLCWLWKSADNAWYLVLGEASWKFSNL